MPLSRPRERWSNLQRREFLFGLLFVSPFLIGVLLFWVGPMLYSVFLTTQKWNMIAPPQFVGLRNINKLLADPLVRTALLNTAYYTFIGVPLQLTVAFTLALMLNRSMAGRAVYRTIYYLPSLTPAVASAVVWLQILSQKGLLNQFIANFGFEPINWLFQPAATKPAFILMSLWSVGPQMIIFLAGLQNVPQELMEAAEIDGASTWRRFRNITLPLISPVLFFNLVVGIIGSFQIFTGAFIMTNGGPQNATLFMVLYIYRQGFMYFDMGYAALLSWLLFFVIMIFTAIQFRISNRWVYYEVS
ncbi:MAG: sugar ABC transporter permease [Verrucomicrobia bacterium]|nr:sugar ABC transporter permease [Verrucomicrobiota bacterium]